MNSQIESNPEVLHLRHELSHWRSENKAPKRIPEGIWQRAVQLAQQHGTGLVARTLKLDYGCLKRRIVGPNLVKSSPEQDFFELFSTSSPPIQGCVIHLAGPRGGQARLELAQCSPSGLATLIRELGL